MAVGDAYVFPGFLTPVLTQLFFPKPPTTFLTCFCRGERRKYAGKKSRLNRGSNSQPPGHSPTRSPLSHPGGAPIDHINTDYIKDNQLHWSDVKNASREPDVIRLKKKNEFAEFALCPSVSP